jgi:hypothetical protein
MYVKIMNKTWQEWFATLRHPKTPVGSYNPLEDHMYEAWVAGWRAAKTDCNEGRECPEKK